MQRQLQHRVELAPLGHIRTVLGLDCAFHDDRVLAVGVVWDPARQRIVETRGASMALRFPYVPGLLSFRELPVLLKVMRAVHSDVDLVMCDGQGIAHPRRLGIASHLGVVSGIPAVGVAKSRLTGRFEPPDIEAGSVTLLLAENSTERLGSVVRTRRGVKPLFVSPGHLCDHKSAVRIVLRCCVGYRLPEPTRLADRLVAAYKREGRFRGSVRPQAQ